MKNVIGLEYYRKYQKELELLRQQVSEKRSENDTETTIKLVHNDEFKQTITKYFAISIVLVCVFIGLFTLLLKIISKTNLLWINIIILIVWGLIFIVLFTVCKEKKKKILKEKIDINQKEIECVQKYQEKQEELYKLVIYIICLNEYYFELIDLDKEKLENKWKEITTREIEVINKKINYVINTYTYQQYFNDWLEKQEIYG